MATFENRSRYAVEVKHRDDLRKTFPYDQPERARAYLLELRKHGYKPTLLQLEDTIRYRVRAAGYKTQIFIAGSWAAARRDAAKIEGEHATGLFVDYTKAHHVTVAQLMQTYIDKECKGHKGKDGEVYRLRAFIADSTGELKKLLAKDEAARENNEPSVWANGRKRPKRTPIEHLEWVQRPLACVQASDINEYVEARCESVGASTVDREIDVLSQVFTMAITYWGYTVGTNPMLGVRRPKFFNERNRRLVGDEETRLLAGAREEDRLRSIALEVERLLEPKLEESLGLASKSARKKFLAAARKEIRPAAEKSYVHVALYETFIQFLLATAARRSEALTLEAIHVDLEAQTAFLPETKNGIPRKLPLMSAVVQSLRVLLDGAEGDGRVFPISVDELKNAWERICERAEITGLNVHDIRHEGISRVADTGKFSLVDLQVYAGHRDPRSTLRYAHLCATKLAHRLDEAFKAESMTYDHKGRRRLKGGAPVSIGELIRETSRADELVDLVRQVLSKLEERPVQGTEGDATGRDAVPAPHRAVH